MSEKLKVLRTDLARMNNIKEGRQRIAAELEQKYQIQRKGKDIVIEELKQRVITTAAKIKRYSDRVKQYQQNQQYITYQKRFYQSLAGKQQESVPAPDPNAALDFWSNIWARPHNHRTGAEWITEVRTEFDNIQRQERIEISAETLKKVLGKLSPWKAAGPDGVQGYWVKNFTSLHERMVEQLNALLETGITPEWMTTGRTVLIPKDPKKGNIPSNYRPITCLPIMYKMITAMISDSMYKHLESTKLCHGNRRAVLREAGELMTNYSLIRA